MRPYIHRQPKAYIATSAAATARLGAYGAENANRQAQYRSEKPINAKVARPSQGPSARQAPTDPNAWATSAATPSSQCRARPSTGRCSSQPAGPHSVGGTSDLALSTVSPTNAAIRPLLRSWLRVLLPAPL